VSTSKKRLLLFILFVLLFTLSSSASVLAKEKHSGSFSVKNNVPGPQVTGFPDHWVVEPGDTFTIKFALRNVSDLYGASLDLKFDPAMLQVVQAEDVQLGLEFAEKGNVTIPLVAKDYNGDGTNDTADVNKTGVVNCVWHLLGEIAGLDLNDGKWHSFVQVTFKVRDNVDFQGDEFKPLDFFFTSQSPDTLENDANNGMAVIKLANSQEAGGDVTNVIGYEGYRTSVSVYPPLKAGQYRVVTEWNTFPYPCRELDAHLTIPQGKFKTDVSWLNEGALEEYPYAAWSGDLGYPAEVTTISQTLDGTYEFMVHDYDEEKFDGVTPTVTVFGQDGQVVAYKYAQAQNQGSGSWWHVFTMENGNFSGVNTVNKGIPTIQNVYPEILSGTPAFNLQIDALNVSPGQELVAEIYTGGENPALLASSDSVQVVEQWENSVTVNAAINAGEGLTPGAYQLVLKVDGQYTTAYPIKVTNNPVLMWHTYPPLQKAGVTSFTLEIPGYNLSGKQFTAKLKNNEGEIIAQSTKIDILDLNDEYLKQLKVTMEVPQGQNGIAEGMYFLEFQSELEVLNLWGKPYDGYVWFAKEPVFYGIEPDSLKTNELLTTPVCVSGWNIAGQDWIVKVYDENGTMVHQYPAMEAAVQGDNGMEGLPEFNLPDFLEAGEYWLEICNTDGEQVGTVFFGVERSSVDSVVTNIEIKGVDLITIPGQGSKNYYYNALIKDQDGFEIPEEGVTWSLQTPVNGITLTQTMKKAVTVTIDSSVADGSFILRATSDSNNTILAEKQVTLKKIPAVTVSSKTGIIGNIVKVPVIIDKINGMASYNVELIYDAQVLTPVDIENGNILTGQFAKNLTYSPNSIIATASQGVPAVSGDTLIIASFKVNDSVQVGTNTEVNAKVIIEDENANEIKVNILPGKLYLTDMKYGDVNGDGKITPGDATLVLRHAAKLITLSDNQQKAADVSGDGKITPGDATLILRYIAKLINAFPVESK
jgi:hypothetical protein